jgi:transcriptional regulator with XRE-family HTH domain
VARKTLQPSAVLAEPSTVGEHIRRKRLHRGLTQKEAAALIGVDADTVLNWEKGQTVPSSKFFSAIVYFLGYVPLPQPTTLSERLYYIRYVRGWSIKEASQVLGIHEETWAYWERGKRPQRRMQKRLQMVLCF